MTKQLQQTFTYPLPEGVKFGTLDKEKTNSLWDKFKQFDVLFSDDTRGDKVAFFQRMWDTNSVFLETSGGILMANELKPGLSAQVHVSFWDKKLSERSFIMKECLKWLVVEYDLHRLEAWIPEFSRALRRFLERKLKFVYEGRLRSSMWYKGQLTDIIILSLLRKEVLNG